MSKIEIKHKTLKSVDLNLPIDGIITLSDEGVVEVSEECAKIMCKDGSGNWTDVKAEASKGKVEFDKDDELSEFLGAQNEKSLRHFVTENKLEEAKPKTYKKASNVSDLVVYIMKHLSDEGKQKVLDDIPE